LRAPSPADLAGVPSRVTRLEIAVVGDPHVHPLLGSGGVQRLLVEGSTAVGLAPEFRHDLGRREDPGSGDDLEDLLPDEVSKLQSAAAVELVLHLGSTGRDALGLVIGGLGAVGESGLLGLEDLDDPSRCSRTYLPPAAMSGSEADR